MSDHEEVCTDGFSSEGSVWLLGLATNVVVVTVVATDVAVVDLYNVK